MYAFTPGDPKRGPYVLGVEHLKTGQLLGHVGFSPLDDGVEISYAIAQAWRCRGHGVQAMLESAPGLSSVTCAALHQLMALMPALNNWFWLRR